MLVSDVETIYNIICAHRHKNTFLHSAMRLDRFLLTFRKVLSGEALQNCIFHDCHTKQLIQQPLNTNKTKQQSDSVQQHNLLVFRTKLFFLLGRESVHCSIAPLQDSRHVLSRTAFGAFVIIILV